MKLDSEDLDKLTNEQIDISKDDEITYWSNLLSCTKEDLIQSVLTIGNSATIINTYLQLNRKKIKNE
jgi:hypothetical protein